MKALALCFAVLATPAALATNQQSVIATYAATAFTQYSSALEGARSLQAAIETFLADPNEANLTEARQAWLKAREAYSPTEIYRFYSGPIDDQDGPEGLINAWPLDEAYIDYVQGDNTAGIIQQPDLYPDLTSEVLASLNEKDGETNIATGYHAIEFLLWGQDLSATGPGNRPASDYVTAPFAQRRKEYLRLS